MLSRAVMSARSVALASAARGMATAALDASRLVVSKTTSPRTKVTKEELQFGKTFSDHMLEMDWTVQDGWAAPRIGPYGPLAIDPSASVLHYGLECFEGMKAYLDKDGQIRMFRPDMNMARLNRSMARFGFPAADGETVTELIKDLLRVDRDWIPEGDGFSLYLRPTAISTHNFLGVSASESIKLYVITCPVGPYYPTGFKPVRLLADTKNVRAWPGGVGDAKVGGNYAPTIKPQAEAAAKGYSQVLWLLGEEDGGLLTEVGTMNLFVYLKNEHGEDELVTPPLDGTILPGVTRDSVLALARSWGEFKVSERPMTVGELTRAIGEGRVHEAFGCGTAVVVSPIEGFAFKGDEYTIPLDKADPSAGSGPLTKRFWDSITDIQYGRVDHEWSVVV